MHQRVNKALRSSLAVAFATFQVSLVTAGNVAAPFSVSVTLSGICTSSALNRATNAYVLVTCEGKEFVGIEARPGRPFVGTHGGAYRYTFSGTSLPMLAAASASSLGDRVGLGTVTAFRVMNLTESDEQPEFLITF